MKKIYLLFILLFAFSQVRFAAGELVITQYYEGSGSNKYIEFTNVGDATIDFAVTQYYALLYSNARADDPSSASPNNNYAFSGTLVAGGIILLKNSASATPAYAVSAGTNSTICNFNGDDLVAVSLSNSSTAGVAWAARTDVIGNGTTWGANKSFSRKISDVASSSNYDAAIWTQYTNAQVDGANIVDNEYLSTYTGYSALPVELTSFTAASTGSATVVLKWTTATEVNNYGFEIEASTSSATGWENVGFVEGHGNSNSPKEYSYIDNSGATSYRLKQVDTDGSFEYSDVVTVAGNSVNKLNQNYPNPFNPTTQISFSIAKVSNVSISVYNALGQKVAEVLNQNMNAGSHTVNFNGSNLASGFYFYRLETPNYSKTMKMMLIK